MEKTAATTEPALETTMAPEPATVALTVQPVTTASEVVTIAPEPVSVAPEPVVAAPEPVVVGSEPVVAASEPAADAPEPVAVQARPPQQTDIPQPVAEAPPSAFVSAIPISPAAREPVDVQPVAAQVVPISVSPVLPKSLAPILEQAVAPALPPMHVDQPTMPGSLVPSEIEVPQAPVQPSIRLPTPSRPTSPFTADNALAALLFTQVWATVQAWDDGRKRSLADRIQSPVGQAGLTALASSIIQGAPVTLRPSLRVGPTLTITTETPAPRAPASEAGYQPSMLDARRDMSQDRESAWSRSQAFSQRRELPRPPQQWDTMSDTGRVRSPVRRHGSFSVGHHYGGYSSHPALNESDEDSWSRHELPPRVFSPPPPSQSGHFGHGPRSRYSQPRRSRASDYNRAYHQGWLADDRESVNEYFDADDDEDVFPRNRFDHRRRPSAAVRPIQEPIQPTAAPAPAAAQPEPQATQAVAQPASQQQPAVQQPVQPQAQAQSVQSVQPTMPPPSQDPYALPASPQLLPQMQSTYQTVSAGTPARFISSAPQVRRRSSLCLPVLLTPTSTNLFAGRV